MFSIQPNASSRTGKKSTDDIKRRLQSVLGYSPHAIYFGFVPLVIYLGFKLGPDPGTPEFSLINLLPIDADDEKEIGFDFDEKLVHELNSSSQFFQCDDTKVVYFAELIVVIESPFDDN
ncbi:unnamed protein product, partial [Rotaria socialis]